MLRNKKTIINNGKVLKYPSLIFRYFTRNVFCQFNAPTTTQGKWSICLVKSMLTYKFYAFFR